MYNLCAKLLYMQLVKNLVAVRFRSFAIFVRCLQKLILLAMVGKTDEKAEKRNENQGKGMKITISWQGLMPRNVC